MSDFLVCTYCGLAAANFINKGKKQNHKLHCPCYLGAVYCDKTCQKKDWKRHKKHCTYRLLQKDLELPAELSKIVCRFAAED